MLLVLLIAVAATLLLAAINFALVRRADPGTEEMREIAAAIRDGADAFIRHEYRVIAGIAVPVALILGLVVAWYAGVAFALGALMSASAGWVGMRIATIANVRVANAARETGEITPTLRLAFRGGTVMGLCVAGFALAGLLLVYLGFGVGLGQLEPAAMQVVPNAIGLRFIPFTMSVSGYALGCSLIAMFDRVGGGIYTKAADMGADLVGKTEVNIPEDDVRNPATIADNVGDNVGDVAGLGADLLESFVGAIAAAVVLAAYSFFTSQGANTPTNAEQLSALIRYPLLFAGVGTIASILGILLMLVRRRSASPRRDLEWSTGTSAVLAAVGGGIAAWLLFGGLETVPADFRLGWAGPWLAALLGIASGIGVGRLAAYFTAYEFEPTQLISSASLSGYALNITQGLAIGMKSVFSPLVVLSVAVIGSYWLAGLYGVAMAAVGMLSFVAATVSVDTYGPIADNAGGISEMSHLPAGVRSVTDRLDSVGNTTAAIGKGFAIGSAALASLSLFASYLFSQAGPLDIAGNFVLDLNMIDALTLAGSLVGAALPFLFSGILIEAVASAAGDMVQEVRRQFREDPGILAGTSRPDYRRCIQISSRGSLREMRLPALIAVLSPLAAGFLFGPRFVGGLLIGTTLSAIMLALFTANAGGAWDNAKKFIEEGNHGGKGSEAHAASVVGDTVGDPLKDTVGPSLDILIKIMAVISLIAVPAFKEFNLLSFLG